MDAIMRLMAAVLVACLAACSGEQTQSEQSLVGRDEEMRHRLAIQDVEAILQGMQQARERDQELARSAP
jgi:hypothetical protein